MMRIAAVLIALAIVALISIWAISSPGSETVIASYQTSLIGRTAAQIHNASLALKRLNNTVIPPGGIFSFSKQVGPWTGANGYLIAPVSFQGRLVDKWGGSVCQTSSTLYNAALLAGLEIIERHPHHWAPKYVPLGRDAAVAYNAVDLKFRNNLPEPVRITGEVEGDLLVFYIHSRCKPQAAIDIVSEIRSISKPANVVHMDASSGRKAHKIINPGRNGFCVITYRRFISDKGSSREFISEDKYPVMHRIIRASAE